MAGAGYKLFNTGDVLTAAQVNTYLQEQTVMVFANSTARTTALSGVLAEGMMSYLQDTNSVEVYNGTSWVALASGDVTEVQAGTGISVASGTGPIPVVTNTMATAIDAKGDLVVGTGADTFARLAVGGTNGHTLQVDSSTATGLKWAAPAGGGKVLQVVNATFNTQTDTASATLSDLMSATITPSSASSKVLVIMNAAGCAMLPGSSNNEWGEAEGDRASGTATWKITNRIGQALKSADGFGNAVGGFSAMTVRLDEPATTSATTYKIRIKRGNGTGSFRVNSNDGVSSITLMEIGA